MGLMIHSLGELPTNERRGYYVYILDYGWDEPLGNALRANFSKIADLASRHNAVVLQGLVGSHFADEVLSWHHINGQEAEAILPAILVTTRHPMDFRSQEGTPEQETSHPAEHRLVLIPLRYACEAPTDVVRVVLKIFSDIRERRSIADFDIMSELKAGEGGALADSLVLGPSRTKAEITVDHLNSFFEGNRNRGPLKGELLERSLAQQQNQSEIGSRIMEPVNIFFSYAHADEELMHAVRQQLAIFDRQDLIRKWYDRKIYPGSEWKNEIDEHLAEAGIVLLFISPAFFDSDYCYEAEMAEALRRHERGEAVVIPVILRPCLWHSAPFGRLQALPKDGKPITQWSDRDEACQDIAQGIMKVVEQIRRAKKPHIPVDQMDG